MANPNPASDIATKAAALSTYTYGSSTVTLTVNTNLFVGPERAVRTEVPELAVFVQNTTGVAPQPYLGNSEDFFRFQVQVLVRSEPGKFSEGEDLARGLSDKLQRTPPTGYVSLLAQQSGPTWLGEDENRHHRWSLNFEAWWKG